MNNNPTSKKNQGQLPNLSGIHVLVVEDDFFNYKFLEDWMEMRNASVIRAENGQESVDLCHQRKEISLVLMDAQLPGMNGYDATRLIKESRPELPVIMVTANAIREEKIKSDEAGCDGFITKPIDIKVLAVIIGDLLPG